MRTHKILAGLWLCVAIWQPQCALAASYCATSQDGKILMNECGYESYEACKRVVGNSGDCIINQGEQPAPAKVAPYCVVTWATECKYYDYETCNQAAKTQMGFCYLNPDYINPAK